MVKSVEVKNFKSIVDLKLELGRVNVFIGENGSGKSNILEAVAFGAAASANKLDKEFLASRGMRVPEPKLMRSAFSRDNLDKAVSINFIIEAGNKDEIKIDYLLQNSDNEFSKWNNIHQILPYVISNTINAFLTNDLDKDSVDKITRILSEKFRFDSEAIDNLLKVKESVTKYKNEGFNIQESPLDFSGLNFSHPVLDDYKIYTPENTFLRKFEDEDAGDPLGIRGEGLFRLLRYFQTITDTSYIQSISEALSALDWFDSFDIPNGLYMGERRLSIVDRFLDTDVSISQNSANEGFLFILFYISLFVSEDTPPFFAIDNVDASFNPKLCKHITQILVNAAKKSNKQALFTTHNPFILDGLDLTDDEQRLFVVYRSQQGHTITKRVMPNDRKMALSEQWMNGYLGGLPQNF